MSKDKQEEQKANGIEIAESKEVVHTKTDNQTLIDKIENFKPKAVEPLKPLETVILKTTKIQHQKNFFEAVQEMIKLSLTKFPEHTISADFNFKTITIKHNIPNKVAQTCVEMIKETPENVLQDDKVCQIGVIEEKSDSFAEFI